MSETTCSVEGCGKRPQSYRTMCEMHRRRWHRYGQLDRKTRPAGEPYPRSTGYLGVFVPSHVLAGPKGKAFHHRVVLFDAIGYGPHRCCWCGTHINWRVNLVVDHLNAVRDDNRLENLVPACQRCNTRRHRPEEFTAFVTSVTTWCDLRR